MVHPESEAGNPLGYSEKKWPLNVGSFDTREERQQLEHYNSELKGIAKWRNVSIVGPNSMTIIHKMK